MLNSSSLPKNKWGEALLTSWTFLNRIPYRNCNVTPYEMWKGQKPKLNFHKVWSCLAKIKISNIKVNNKLGGRTFDRVLIDYHIIVMLIDF